MGTLKGKNASSDKHSWLDCLSSYASDRVFVCYSLVLLRIVFGSFMLTHGIPKIIHFDTLQANFPDPIGLGSTTALVLIIFAEVICSSLLILGLFTRFASLPLIFGMGAAAFSVHATDPFQTKELALIYLTIYIIIFLNGAGRYSLDFLFFRKKAEDCPLCVINTK